MMNLWNKILVASTLALMVSGIDGQNLPPVGAWEFKDGTGLQVNDSSGRNNHGKITNPLACQWTREDDRGNFMIINNNKHENDAHVLIPDSPSLNFTGPFTALAAFSCETDNGSTQFALVNIFSKGTNYCNGFSMLVNKNSALVVCIKGLTPDYLAFDSKKINIQTNTDYVAGFVYDGKTVTAYLNGSILGTQNVTGKPTINHEPFFIGNYPHGNYQFNGNVYMVRLYDYALSPDNIIGITKRHLKNLPVEGKALVVPTHKKFERDPNAIYYGIEKFEPSTLISDRPNVSKWHLRSAPGMFDYSNLVLHPPTGNLPPQDITTNPGLLGKYDIYIGTRSVAVETAIQFNLTGMTDYYTIILPGGEEHFNVEVPVAAGVIMDNKKLSLHATGINAYICYFKFVKSGEKPFIPAQSVSVKPAMPIQDMTTQVSKFRERVYVEKTPMPKLTTESQQRGYLLFPVNLLKLVFPVTNPDRDYGIPQLSAAATPGEFESVSFAVKALKKMDGVNVTVAEFPVNAQGNRLAAGISVGQVEILAQRPNWTEGYGGEFMYVPTYVEPVKPTDLASDKTKQYYLTFAVAENAVPGRYKGSIKVSSADSSTQTMPIEFEVYPFKTDPLKGLDIGMYVSFYNFGGATIDDEMRDMREHGMTTVFDVERGGMLIISNGKIDFAKSRLPEVVAAYKKYGFEGNAHILTTDIYEYCMANTHSREEYAQTYKKLINQLEEHSRNNGWPKFIYQPNDEILSNLSEFPQFLQEIRLLKEVGVATEVNHMWYKTSRPAQKQIDACIPYIDNFTLRYNSRKLFYVDSWEQILRTCKEKGKPIYAYNTNNATTFPEPAAMRFIGGWFLRTLAEGCSGQFMWGYQYSNGDCYNALDNSQCDLMYHFPTLNGRKGGPSLLWESYREGIDDLKYIVTLENLITKCKAAGKKTIAAEAETFLNDIKQSININSLKQKCVFLESKWDVEGLDAHGKKFASGNFGIPNDWSYDKYDENRKKIARKIIELKTKLKQEDL